MATGCGGCQSWQAGCGEARGAALGRHDGVVNSIHGQRGRVAHRVCWSTAVGGRLEWNCGGGGVRGWWSMARSVGRWYKAARCSWLDGGRTRQHYMVARRRRNKAAQWGQRVGGRLFMGGRGGGWALFIAGRGSGWRRRGGESGGGEMTTGNQRCQRCCGSDRLPMVCASERQLSGRWARSILSGWVGTVDMSWVQSGAQPFSNYSNFAPNFQIQNEDYPDVHKCSNLAWC
jgi:hypothetical protein